MTNSNDNGPILHYLRNIEAKLDSLNEKLDNFLSVPRRKRATRTGDAGIFAERRTVVVGTQEEVEEYRKNNPDDDVNFIITGVVRAKRF